jgi:hypothetical protein
VFARDLDVLGKTRDGSIGIARAAGVEAWPNCESSIASVPTDPPALNLQLVASSFDRYRFRRAEILVAGGGHCF